MRPWQPRQTSVKITAEGRNIVTREMLLHRLAGNIVSINRSHPLRVAIDGIDSAGKTTLADELVPLIEQQGSPVIRASIDGFHRLVRSAISEGQTLLQATTRIRSITPPCEQFCSIRLGCMAVGSIGVLCSTFTPILPFQPERRRLLRTLCCSSRACSSYVLS